MSARGPKQSMTELKLRRLLEHNQRLRDDLARPRIRVSEASARFVQTTAPHPYGSFVNSDCSSLIRYCKTTTDHLVSVQGYFVTAGLSYGRPGTDSHHNGSVLCTLVPPTRLRTVLIDFRLLTALPQIPSVWGPVNRAEDPYAPPTQGCSCILM